MVVIDKILAGINNLPTLPAVYTTLSEALEDPRTSTEKLAQIISSDQASSFKVLKVANSPFYGFRGKIDTISQAILYLGFSEVRNIVFALSVVNIFSKDKILPNFRPSDFWAHSIGVGIATRIIGKAVGEKRLENYFLAGVIHDIGKLVFLEFANKEYIKVLELVEAKKWNISKAEQKIFGKDHAQVGQMLAEKWKLPLSIQNTVCYHHIGITGKDPDLMVASVHIGDIVARILDFGYAGDNMIPEPNIKVWDILKIQKGFFPSIRKQMEEDFEHTIRLMLVE
jgi:HD-like signal output (HDOD) protein